MEKMTLAQWLARTWPGPGGLERFAQRYGRNVHTTRKHALPASSPERRIPRPDDMLFYFQVSGGQVDANCFYGLHEIEADEIRVPGDTDPRQLAMFPSD